MARGRATQRGRSAPWQAAALLAVSVGLLACDSEAPPYADPNAAPGIQLQDGSPVPDAGRYDAGDAAAPAGDGGVDPLPDATPEDEVDSATFAPVAFDVQTRVGDRNTTAGLENRVTCEVLDQVGEPIGGIPTVAEVLPDSGFTRTEGGLIGERARDYAITCFAPGLGLRDATPADWTVLPGRAATVTTVLSTDEIEAGEALTVTCQAFDAVGNVVPTQADAFSVRLDPPPPAADVLGDSLRVRSAGVFDVRCALPGAESAAGRGLTVRPGLPARLVMGLFPQRPVYRVGDIVEVVPAVRDRFDNDIPDAPVVVESDPPLPGFGQGRLRCSPEGRYTLTATVEGDTWQDVGLSAEADILVDFGGPGITCDDPGPGAHILLPDGNHGQLEGTVRDVAGVAGVTVDGVPVDLGNDGRWRADVEQRWGLNVHEVVASDAVDAENSTFCAYFAASDYLPEGAFLESAVQLRMGQGAVDDGDPDRPLASLGDVIRRVINSQGLVDTVDAAARAQNPIVPTECRARVLGVCLFRFGADYTGLAIGGRNTLAITLVDGGLRFRVTIRNLSVRAQLRGTLGNRARIDADDITIDLTFDVGLRFDGTPDLSLRQLNEVRVGDLHSDFSGWLTGAILELAFWAFEGLIRDTITDAIRGFLEDEIDGVLTDLLSGVNLGELSQGVDVPSLTGGAAVPLTFTVGLDRLDVSPARFMVGVKSKIDGPNVLAERSPGVPLPPASGFMELPGDRTVGAAVQLGMLNQVLHRLWRAGYFEAEAGGLAAGVAGGLPDGAEVFLRFPQAPAVVGVEGEPTVRVFLGPLVAGVVYPGFFVEPFRVQLAAEISASVRLVGERELRFEGVRVEALHLALDANVPQRSRQVLEDTLTRVLQGIIDRALNDGLPVIPLPDFAIPADLGRFDLPAGAGLGLRQPRLSGTEARWILDGNFGE